MKQARRRLIRVRTQPRYRLADLLAEMPDGLPLDDALRAWLDAPAVGREDPEAPVRAMRRFMRRARPLRDVDVKSLVTSGRA